MIPTSTPDSINGSKRVHHRYPILMYNIYNRKNTSIYDDFGNLKKETSLKLGTLRPGAS